MSDEPASFTNVAPWYDALMLGVPYEQWVRYLEELLLLFGWKPETVLDLACGTGRVSRLLAEKGYRVTGVDASSGMIEVAKSQPSPQAIEYHCQRAESLDLGRSFDLVVSLFDSLNYLTDPNDLQKCFRRVARHLHSRSLFIFDMNGIYAFQADLFSQESLGKGKSIEYVWKSHYDPKTRLCRVDMEFTAHPEGRSETFREVHFQRAYETEEVCDYLRDAGFDVLAVYDAYATRPVRAKSDRIFWIARLKDSEEAKPVAP
jgi:SAM-dependent methyltransferase